MSNINGARLALYCELPGCPNPADHRLVAHVQGHEVVLFMCDKDYQGRARL